MEENTFYSFLNNIDVGAAMQWYENYANVGYLMGAWQQNGSFSPQDWLGVALLAGNTIALIALVILLIKTYQERLISTWFDRRRSQLRPRAPHKIRTRLEAKISDSRDLKQAYNMHRMAMYKEALEKFRHAVQVSPHDLNTWLVGVKIVSEIDDPDRTFVGFVKNGVASLREARPDLWKEVKRYGKDKVPGLEYWQQTS